MCHKRDFGSQPCITRPLHAVAHLREVRRGCYNCHRRPLKQLILAVLSKAEAKQSVARDSKLTFAAGPRTADTSPLLNLIKTLALLLTDTEMPLPFFVVDAFVDPARPGSGNGAGVMLVEMQLPPAQCLAISSAVGLSETAFVAPVGHGTSGADPFSSSDTFTLTWYTPTTVVNLCGHATLAAAAALRDCGNKSECISFHTASGTLSVVNGSLPGELAMRFPLNAPWRIPEPLPTPIATIVRTVSATLGALPSQLQGHNCRSHLSLCARLHFFTPRRLWAMPLS